MKTNIFEFKLAQSLHKLLKKGYPEYYKKFKKRASVDMTEEEETAFIKDFEKFLRNKGLMKQLH